MPLGKKADAGDYIDDFKKSKAPQFKGKSQKKRKEMAIAAYLSSKNELTNIIRELLKSGTNLSKVSKIKRWSLCFLKTYPTDLILVE